MPETGAFLAPPRTTILPATIVVRAAEPKRTGAVGSAIALGAILLVALAFRSWEWTGRGLWFDEAFTWRLVDFPFLDMMERASRDNSPPLYYVLLHAWAQLFGTSLAVLRGLSVLLGVATAAGMYLFIREAIESRGRQFRGLALFVAALTAVSVFQVRYSDEVRPYALGAALAALSAWALSRSTRPGPSSARAWALYGVFALLFAYTHYYALFVIAAQAAFVAGWLLARAGWRPAAALRSPACRHALLAGGIVFVGWLPWLPTFLWQRAQVQATFWAPAVDRWTLPNLCFQMFINPQPLSPSEIPHRKALITAGLCVAGIVALARRARAAEWHILLAACGPFALAVLASETGTKTLTLRYFLFAHLFLLAGVGVLVWRIRLTTLRLAAAAALLVASSGITLDFLQGLSLSEYPGARGAAEFIKAHRQPGEPVVVASPLWYFAMAYHLDDDGVRVYDPGTPMPHFYGTASLRSEDLMDGREMARLSGRRVWVVNGLGMYWGRQDVPAPANWVERDSASFPESLRVGAAIVQLYEIPSGPPVGR